MTSATLNVFIANLAATLLMTGVIWTMQLVHYPLFAAVGDAAFPEFERRHTVRITWIVVPLMLLELVTAVAFRALCPSSLRAAAAAGLWLLAVIWISTAALQVRYHKVLAAGFSPAVHRRLVSTNWIRTLAWSARSAVGIWIAVGSGALDPGQ